MGLKELVHVTPLLKAHPNAQNNAWETVAALLLASNYSIIITVTLYYNNNNKHCYFSSSECYHFPIPEVPEFSWFTMSTLGISVIFSQYIQAKGNT